VNSNYGVWITAAISASVAPGAGGLQPDPPMASCEPRNRTTEHVIKVGSGLEMRH
jgi:hypothetical protein